MKAVRADVLMLVWLLLTIVMLGEASAYVVSFPAVDDAEERSGQMYLDSFQGRRWLLRGKRSQLAGFRFADIYDKIPFAAEITRVVLRFPGAYHDHIDGSLIRIFGELSQDDPLPFAKRMLSVRPQTAAIHDIHWQPAGNETPNLLPVFSAITGQQGWSKRNGLVFMTEAMSSSPDRARYGVYATGPDTLGKAPRLVVNYRLPESILNLTPKSIDATVFAGYNAVSQSITLFEESGKVDFIGALSADVPWLTVVVPEGGFTGIHPLRRGTSVSVRLDFATAEMAPGIYNGTVRITGNSSGSPQTIGVTLMIKEPEGVTACGEVPVYTEDTIHPAVMVELDTSGSMNTRMPIMAGGKNPRTPSIAKIVQEIVNRQRIDDPAHPFYPQDGWEAGNSMGIVVSGTGRRRAHSYDSQITGAPKLIINYTTQSGSKEVVSAAIDHSEGDVQLKYSSTVKGDENYLELGRMGNPVGLVFPDIEVPQGALIEHAAIEFVIHSKDSKATSLVIKGVALDDAPSFTDMHQLVANLTDAAVSWNDVAPWDGTMSRLEIARDVLAEMFLDRSINWGFATWSGGDCTAQSLSSDTDWTDFHVGVHDHDRHHQERLQSITGDGQAMGCTPLVPAMTAGLHYYQGGRTDGYYGETYQALGCQRRVLVLITDGVGNTGTTMDLVEARTRELINEGISLVAVGFGVSEAQAGQLYTIARLAQAAGKIDQDDAVLALHEESDAGEGVPFLTQSREELMNAMHTIAGQIKTANYYGANPVMTTIEDGDVLLTSSFDPYDWSGDLRATRFDVYSGHVEPETLWQASAMMPNRINGFIYDKTAPYLVSRYTDTSLATDNYLCKALGDIVHSTPKVVGKPPNWYGFDEYQKFKYDGDVAGRPAMVYVGANDGALHAFSLENGIEKYRFYPAAMKSALNEMGREPGGDMCSPSYCHRYMVDGSPQAADIYADERWKTVLITGLGRGGSGYFGLDVTYGNSLGPELSQDKKDTPGRFLWEFTDSELGLATSLPEIKRVQADLGGKAEEAGWLAFWGSGSSDNIVHQPFKEAYLFGIDANSGKPRWLDRKQSTTSRVKLSPILLQDDRAGSPLVVDLNDDGFGDLAYIGNMYGNIYRVKDIGIGQTPLVDTFFFAGQQDHKAPVLAKPAYGLAEDPDNDGVHDIWLYFGSGRYEEQSDKFSAFQQHFYGLFDEEGCSFSHPNSLGSTWVPEVLKTMRTEIIEGYARNRDGTRVDRNNDGTIDDNDRGRFRTILCEEVDSAEDCLKLRESWRLQLFVDELTSERSLEQPLVVAGIVFFTTFIPDRDPCGGQGESWLFALDWQTGGFVDDAVFDINGDGQFDESDKAVEEAQSGAVCRVGGIYLGRGRPTAPAIYNDNLFIGTTGSPPRPIKVNIPDHRAQLKAWRQVLDS